MFIFDSSCGGNTVIMDFNKNKGEMDKLFLSREIVSSADEFISCLKQVNSNVDVNFGDINISLINTSLDNITHSCVIVVWFSWHFRQAVELKYFEVAVLYTACFSRIWRYIMIIYLSTLLCCVCVKSSIKNNSYFHSKSHMIEIKHDLRI